MSFHKEKLVCGIKGSHRSSNKNSVSAKCQDSLGIFSKSFQSIISPLIILVCIRHDYRAYVVSNVLRKHLIPARYLSTDMYEYAILEGYSKEQAEKYVTQYVLDNGIRICICDLNNIFD